jgi:hypothetical protein
VENRRYALYGLQLNAPLPSGSLPRVECKTVGQQGLADVVEPGVVALQGWAFQARFPEHNVSSSVVANGTVIVGEGDASGGAGDRHPRKWVPFGGRPLAGCGNVRQLPPVVALAPHVDRPVLAQGATIEPFKVVSLLHGVEGPCVDAAIPVDGTVGVAEAVPLAPVHLERAARAPTKVARVSLRAVLPCVSNNRIVPLQRLGLPDQEEEQQCHCRGDTGHPSSISPP